MKSTTRFTRNMRGIECLNCEQPISDNDNFCSNCGQVNDELPLSVGQFISEFFAGFFSFDSRFLKTFVPLLFKPGKVSKDYTEGKRKRYVNPFQLYLHITILFFLLQGLFSVLDEYKIQEIPTSDNKENAIITSIDSLKNHKELSGIIENVPLDQIKDSILSEIDISQLTADREQKIKTRIDSIFRNTNFILPFKNPTSTKEQKDSIYSKYLENTLEFELQNIVIIDKQDWKEYQNISKYKKAIIDYTDEKFKANNITYSPPEDIPGSWEDEIISATLERTFFKKFSSFMTFNKEHEDASALEALDSLNYVKTRWNIFYYKKATDINKFKSDEDFRDSYQDKMISNISIALFFLLPVFTLFLGILFYRHKKNYTEHLVLVFNVQTVFFILLILFTTFNRILDTEMGIPLFIITFLFYLYKSLRNFYKQGRIKTLVKFALLNFAYLFLSVIGTGIIAFATFVL